YIYGNYPQRTEIFSTMAFAANYTGGVFVAAGDGNADGKGEIIFSQGEGGTAEGRVLRGSDAAGLARSAPLAHLPGTDGVRVTSVDQANNGRSSIVVGAGNGSTRVRTLDGSTLAQQSEFTAYDPGFQGGVFVG